MCERTGKQTDRHQTDDLRVLRCIKKSQRIAALVWSLHNQLILTRHVVDSMQWFYLFWLQLCLYLGYDSLRIKAVANHDVQVFFSYVYTTSSLLWLLLLLSLTQQFLKWRILCTRYSTITRPSRFSLSYGCHKQTDYGRVVDITCIPTTCCGEIL